MLVITVVSLTSTIGYRFYNEPKLDVGKAAPQTIHAPDSITIIDTKTTEEKRKAARTGSVPVLMLDQAVTQKIHDDLTHLLQQGNDLRELGGSFPYVDPAILPTSTQHYLRQAEEWEWRAILEATENATKTSPLRSQSATKAKEQATVSASSTSSLQQQAIVELKSYQRTTSTEKFSALVQQINQVRRQYPIASATLSDPSLTGSHPFYNASLFDLTDEAWQQTQTGVRQAAERILTQGYPPGLPKQILQDAVRMQLSVASIPPAAEVLSNSLLLAVLQPNLVKNPEETELQAEQAAQAVQPVLVTVRRGEVIVKADEAITPAQFVLLDYFNLSRRGVNWPGLIGFGGLVSGAVGVFWLVERRFHPGLRLRDHVLVLLLTLSTPLLVILGVSATSLPAIGLLVGSFYGSALGVAGVGLLSVLLPIGMNISWGPWLSSAAGGLVGGLIAGRLRSREELALLGGAVGVTQGVVYLILNLIFHATANPIWYTMLGAATLYSLAGLAWSIVALGLSPYLEHLFDLVTPIRLAELASPNRPLLKRLASEAPGTFQHTLFVSTLAEAAARGLGCNVDLVRAGTLYHDIGKMHDPLGFIENQMGGPNKHDAINDPWKSAALIKNHVTEGLVMARKYRLPKAIQAFIPEHQGTMLIAYFYHQAQQQAQQDPNLIVQESDFRYDGPIPQSRETGILMLADSCEAALRSLKDATLEEALAMVNRILKARWQDNQMADSGLTRAEMSQIADIFVRVWQQFNHQRIAYPKAVTSAQ
jgi:hypothetical protein